MIKIIKLNNYKIKFNNNKFKFIIYNKIVQIINNKRINNNHKINQIHKEKR